MNTLQALQQRKSVRAFLDREVEREKIETILAAAGQTPSGSNLQPWQVAVVSGATKKKLQERIEKKFRQGNRGDSDYQYYPTAWVHPYKRRRVDCGRQLYQAINIERHDKQRRLDQWAANYRSFDAPVMLLFFMDASMETGSFLDCGMFIQSIMLAAVDQGLATCTQAALADYPEIIKPMLGYPHDSVLLCGMALGYEDKDDPINKYRTPREPVNSFARYFT